MSLHVSGNENSLLGNNPQPKSRGFTSLAFKRVFGTENFVTKSGASGDEIFCKIVLVMTAVFALSTPFLAALPDLQGRILSVAFALFFCGLAVYAYLAARHERTDFLPSPPPPEYAELEQHVTKLTTDGLSHDSIRDRLIGAGWPAEKVDLVLHNTHRPDQCIEKLLFYVKDQMRRQQPKEQIRDRLLQAHWDPKLVSLVLG